MKNQEKDTLDRVLKKQHFEIAKKAVEGSKKSGTLKNPELNEELIEKFKGKTVQAPIEAIITCAIFLEAREIIGVIEVLKHTFKTKVAEELKAKFEKGEVTAEDVKAALLLAATMNEENTKQKDKSYN